VKQPADVDPAFTSVAWNPNRAIVYEVQVTPGSRKRIALGWADGRYNMPMHRVMDAIVEGAPTLEIAPVRDSGQGKPHVKFFDAYDADNDGWIRITVAPSASGVDPNPLLNGIWVFSQGSQVTEAEVIDGRARAKAEKVIDAGNDLHGHMPGRTDLLVGASTEYQNMKVVVRTNLRLEWNDSNKQLTLNGKPWLTTVPAATGMRAIEGGYELALPLSNRVVVAVMHGNNPRIPTSIADADQAAEELAGVWEKQRERFPFPIRVPDLDIQDVLEANWDNLHRMKDTVETWQQYHIGPSVYRGLWVVDATMLMQGAIVNGDTSGTRHMVEAVGRHQKANGHVEVMVPNVMYRETASYIQQIVMYAEYSGDDQWLLNRWDRVRLGLNYLRELRETTLVDPNAVYYGLSRPVSPTADSRASIPNIAASTTRWGPCIRRFARCGASISTSPSSIPGANSTSTSARPSTKPHSATCAKTNSATGSCPCASARPILMCVRQWRSGRCSRPSTMPSSSAKATV
jgi:hypothetical protein